MADTKISDMTPGSALSGPELFEMTQSAATFSTTATAMKTWVCSSPTLTGTPTSGVNLTFSAIGAGPVLKQGSNGRTGTFVCNGATPVTVGNTSLAAGDLILISLSVVGGTVGAIPAVQTRTASSGFTVAGTASDVSTYRYLLIATAA